MEILGEQKVIELVSKCQWNYSRPTVEEAEEMEEILSHYYDPNEWELDEFEPISEGVSNTNYKISVRRKFR